MVEDGIRCSSWWAERCYEVVVQRSDESPGGGVANVFAGRLSLMIRTGD